MKKAFVFICFNINLLHIRFLYQHCYKAKKISELYTYPCLHPYFIKFNVGCSYTGRPPIIVVLKSDSTGNEERRKRLEQKGAIDVFQMSRESGNLSEATQLELLKLLGRCVADGDEVNIIRHLEMYDPCLAYAEKLRQMRDRGKKEATILAQQKIEEQKIESHKKLETSERALSSSKQQVHILENNNERLQKEVKIRKEELTKTRETKITLDRKLDHSQTNNAQLQRDLQKERNSLQSTTQKVQQLETDKVRLQKELNDSTIEGKNKADALTRRTHENENH